MTGDQRRTELANDATSVASQFELVLLIFAGVSLIMAAFVIYNTFASLLAQRIRETGLLRCAGARQAQIFTAVLAEAACIGVVGAVAGLLAGAGVAYGLIRLLTGVGAVDIPLGGIVMTPGSVIAALVTGVATTTVAA